MLYDRFREACEKRGTTITQVLRDIGRAEGNTGSWKAGKSPKLDIVMEMAEHLNMTLDILYMAIIHLSQNHQRKIVSYPIWSRNFLRFSPTYRRTDSNCVWTSYALIWSNPKSMPTR